MGYLPARSGYPGPDQYHPDRPTPCLMVLEGEFIQDYIHKGPGIFHS